MNVFIRPAVLRNVLFALVVASSISLGTGRSVAAEAVELSRAETVAALRRAVVFYRAHVSVQGSYGYRASADLARRDGEQVFTSTLALVTGDARYLEPVPRVLNYLRSSLLPDGRLARFYELRTNRPLFMTRSYQLTYDGSDVPTHYSFFIRPQLGAIEERYAEAKRELEAGNVNRRAMEHGERSVTAREAAAVIAALDARGAWVEPGTIRIEARQRAAQNSALEGITLKGNRRRENARRHTRRRHLGCSPCCGARSRTGYCC